MSDKKKDAEVSGLPAKQGEVVGGALVPGTAFIGMDTALETQDERPDFMESNVDDGIEMSELRLPRLGFAQGLSPQITPGKSNFIEGLNLFDMFNDLTSEPYGRKPLYFIPIRRDVRYIEFIPRSEGGGIRDLNVPPGDPRTQWTVAEDGETRIPPKATKFVEFIAILLHQDRAPEPIVISVKDTNKWNRDAHSKLTMFIKLPTHVGPAPIYGRIYTVESGSATNDKGTFAVPVFRNPKLIVKHKGLYEFAKAFRESLEGKTIVVNRDEPDDIDDSMAANEPAVAAGQGEAEFDTKGM